MKYPFPVVRVLWLDAETTLGWEGLDELKKDPPLIMTVGFLLHSDDKGIIVASTACAERNSNARIIIPLGMVQDVREIAAAGTAERKPRQKKVKEAA